MTLQDLPIEILGSILRFIGSDELQKQDGCGLLVCKIWYQVARPLLLADLRLSAAQLLEAPVEVHSEIKARCRLLTIDLNGSSDWREEDTELLNSTLNGLVDGNNYLRSLTFRASKQSDPARPLALPNPYITKWNPTPFFNALNTSKLAHLVIDTQGSDLSRTVHICPLLGLQIPALVSLRLRMRSICPCIFDFAKGDGVPKIESVIVHLGLEDSERLTKAFSHHCTMSRSVWDLYKDMIAAGVETATKTPSLKECRILCPQHPWPDIMTMNCITGRRTVLAGKIHDWSDEGV